MADSYRSAKDRLGVRPDQPLYQAGKSRRNHQGHDDRSSTPPGRNRPTNRDVREARSYDDDPSDLFGERSEAPYRPRKNRDYDRDSRDSRSSQRGRKPTHGGRSTRSERDRDTESSLYKVKKDNRNGSIGSKTRGKPYKPGNQPGKYIPKSPFTPRNGGSGHIDKFDFNKTSFRGSSRGFRGGSRGGRGGHYEDRGPPKRSLPKIDEEEIKTFLGSRWVGEQNLIDLTSVKADEFWIGKMRKFEVDHKSDIDIFAGLVNASIPTLANLSFSKNGLKYVSQLEPLGEKLPNLISLDLSRNMLAYHSIKDLRSTLGKWENLQELNLLENPVMENADVHEIAAQLRKDGLFKNLVKLNAVELPKAASFGLSTTKEAEEKKGLPEKIDVAVNEQVASTSGFQDFLLGFLEELITRFDTRGKPDNTNPERCEKLLPLYDQDACLSMTFNNGRCKDTNDDICHLFKFGRNLNVKSLPKTHLYQGKEEIMGVMSKLPDFDHQSYNIVDIAFADLNSYVHVTYTGKISEKVSPTLFATRNVTRSLILAKNREDNSDIKLTIVNDMIAFKAVASSQKSGNAQLAIKAAEEVEAKAREADQVSQLAAALMSEEQKTQALMIQKFMGASKLKIEGAKQILESTGYNYDQAAQTFQERRAEIPSDWFVAT